jgi:hypothetical protein
MVNAASTKVKGKRIELFMKDSMGQYSPIFPDADYPALTPEEKAIAMTFIEALPNQA